MNIFKIYWGYRNFGLSYGLPTLHIEMGPGISYSPEALLEKVVKGGLQKDNWVLLSGNPTREKGSGVLVDGLKFIRTKVEIEEDGKSPAPGWFPKPDRWIVDWVDKGPFNYGALRSRQDMLVCRSSNIDTFLESTKKLNCIKVIICKDVVSVWEKVRCLEVRVYAK